MLFGEFRGNLKQFRLPSSGEQKKYEKNALIVARFICIFWRTFFVSLPLPGRKLVFDDQIMRFILYVVIMVRIKIRNDSRFRFDAGRAAIPRGGRKATNK